MAEPANAAAKTSAAKESDHEFLTALTDSLKRYTPAVHDRHADTFDGRYKIELNAPLPEFNTRTARAYAASDANNRNKTLFALVCQANVLQRHSVIAQMKLINHPHILRLVAAGVVNLSQPEESRFVLFYERPAGRKLSEVLSSLPGATREFFLCNSIIAPLGSAINHLSEFTIAHGSINIDNIYFSDKLVLGDCVSEPCGYSQPFYYEPLERLQALPAGKGEGNGTQDYYALAVLVLNILHGTAHFSSMSKQKLIGDMLKEGSFNALTRQREVPEIFYDFFRGLISLSGKDRWDFNRMRPWLEGKRYNVLMPAPPPEAVRPYEIGGEETTRRRELAHLIYTHWDKAVEPLKSGHLLHWVTVSLRDKEMAEQIGRISHIISEIPAKNQIQLDEQIMRVILLFDPVGPIRLQPLAFHADGLGTLCAELFVGKSEKELQLLAKFVEFDMISFWLELQRSQPDYVMPPVINALMLKLDRLRSSIRSGGYGFGPERLLYELNPDMPCQSPMFTGLHVMSYAPLLIKLDQLAASMAKNQDPLDRHMAAFLCAKLGIQHEIRLHELNEIPALAQHRSVIALKLLATAQQKAGNIPLPGITHWLAMRILPALDHIKSRSLRAKVKATLVQQASRGYLTPMAELVIYSGYAAIDHGGYERARSLFLKNSANIVAYRKGDHIEERSARLGLAIAQILAYLAFGVSLWSVISHG